MHHILNYRDLSLGNLRPIESAIYQLVCEDNGCTHQPTQGFYNSAISLAERYFIPSIHVSIWHETPNWRKPDTADFFKIIDWLEIAGLIRNERKVINNIAGMILRPTTPVEIAKHKLDKLRK